MAEQSYRHKKFDQRQRSLKRSHDKHEGAAHSCSTPSRSETTDFDITERLSSSPFVLSTDSNCSTEFAVFSGHFRDTSTPLAKRRKLLVCPLAPSEDSGISMTTPQKQERPSERIVTPFCSPKIKLERSMTSPMVMASTTAAILPQISNETLQSICKYHGNMVRKFPKKERTPKDQERRNKNTLACRMSRRVKKLEHIAIEEQYKEFAQQHMDIVEESLRAAVYLHELMKLNVINVSGGDAGKSDVTAQEKPTSSMRCGVAGVAHVASFEKKKPFSIAYLVGAEENVQN